MKYKEPTADEKGFVIPVVKEMFSDSDWLDAAHKHFTNAYGFVVVFQFRRGSIHSVLAESGAEYWLIHDDHKPLQLAIESADYPNSVCVIIKRHVRSIGALIVRA